MPFDQTSIAAVRTTLDGGQLLISWDSSAPPGTWFQVYVGRRLAWHGRARDAAIPEPETRTRIDVGAVGPGERASDFGADLPPSPSSRVTLTWEVTDAESVTSRIYASAAPGGPVSYVAPIAEVPTGAPGTVLAGFGTGGFGEGGFGGEPAYYRWTSGDLASGVWSFGVVAVDAAGNESLQSEVSATVAAPPQPPARNASGLRLTYTYSAVTHKVTLHWLPSPG